MIVDLVSSDWQVLTPGDETAHAGKAVAVGPELKVDVDLPAARPSQTAS